MITWRKFANVINNLKYDCWDLRRIDYIITEINKLPENWSLIVCVVQWGIQQGKGPKSPDVNQISARVQSSETPSAC